MKSIFSTFHIWAYLLIWNTTRWENKVYSACLHLKFSHLQKVWCSDIKRFINMYTLFHNEHWNQNDRLFTSILFQGLHGVIILSWKYRLGISIFIYYNSLSLLKIFPQISPGLLEFSTLPFERPPQHLSRTNHTMFGTGSNRVPCMRHCNHSSR